MRGPTTTRVRSLLLLGVALLAASVVAACGDSGSGDGGSSTSASAGGSSAQRCETIKIADLDSPEVHASYYAIDEGLVRDDRIGKVEVAYQTVPQLVQNAGSDRYDVTSTSINGVVFVRKQSGRDYKIVALKQAMLPGAAQIWTGEGSSVQSPEDLEGKTLGVVGIGGTVTAAAQIVLAAEYGVNAAVQGGDLRVTDLDPPTLLNALEKDQVDGGVLFHFPNWLATNNARLRSVADIAKDFSDAYGANIIGGALIVGPDTAEEKAGCITALQEMLRASAEYAHENIEEIAPKVAEKLGRAGVDVAPEYLEYWFDHNEYGNTLEAEWVEGAATFWSESNKLGLVPPPPTADEVVFEAGQ
ncbi:MAG TPA: MqnA/MqnD/SBP family protein [Conexibacter sp.]|nr:MqnA/MqnD/SBP family protein [Conexibacter sp.]